MKTDRQVMRMRKDREAGKALAVAAASGGMSERTARKYMSEGKNPSQMKMEHGWRTREDPFEIAWGEVRRFLELFPNLEATTLLWWLQRESPGRFQDGQLRTLQRRVKMWRATEGPAKEVFFPQEHSPGQLCESDFTDMSKLEVTIQGQRFEHLLYHFVLAYSNWETGRVCFSESYESLSFGLQDALWKAGGVPRKHRTDRLSAAVNNLSNVEEFTRRYEGLLAHYGLEGQKTRAGRGNENGDVEQRHFRLKEAVSQWLMLRGSRDFVSRQEYEAFLEEMFEQLNGGRTDRFEEERRALQPLPRNRLEDAKRLQARVGPTSTIHVLGNVYSVHSRLVRERVDVRVYHEHLEVWYAQRCVETIPRLRGKGGHRIQYRHIIEWLARKPGAFAQYRYRSEMFPTTRFRMAYDALRDRTPSGADREYLAILLLAAQESESGVDQALGMLLDAGWTVSAKAVGELVREDQTLDAKRDPAIGPVDLAAYDSLLEVAEVAQ